MSFKGLKPELVWKHFYNMTQIPHPSGKEEKIREHFIAWAKKHGFEYLTDETGNLLVRVPGTKGYENRPITVMQGHMDMVAAKTEDSKVDPNTDPLDVYVEGDYVKARGTTLGADNGIGLACMLALSEDKGAKHPPLELLFTVNEEVDLIGAQKFDEQWLKGRRLINLDLDKFGTIYVGCAGGEDTFMTLPVNFVGSPEGKNCYKIFLKGLKGGHSGLDIHVGKANAIYLMGHVLKDFTKNLDFEMAYVNGGDKRNAIPREAEACVFLKKSDLEKAKKIIENRKKFFDKEYAGLEDRISFSIKPCEDLPGKVMDKNDAGRVINLMLTLPSNPIAMSRSLPGLVETSTNLGVIRTEDEKVVIQSLRRSSVPQALISSREKMQALADLVGASCREGNIFPGWMPNMDSPLLKRSLELYKEKYGEEAKVNAIHAGLETGFIGGKYEDMDMIAMGPDIPQFHNPDECVAISSTGKLYDFLKYLLEKLDD